MKRLSIIIMALALSLTMLAAANVDIIIKTNSEKIEALIQEVSDTEIKYKKANNPNGPLFIVNMAEVATILYANGEVQAVEHKKQQQQNYGYYNSYVSPLNGPMKNLGNDEYMLDGKKLKGKELNFFLQQNCPVAYNYRQKWQKCETAGWCFLGIGAALALGVGGGFYAAYALDRISKDSEKAWKLYTCIAFAGIGGGMMLGSVPLIACGSVYKKRVAEVFNQDCGQQQAFQPELKLTSGANGLGLAIAF